MYEGHSIYNANNLITQSTDSVTYFAVHRIKGECNISFKYVFGSKVLCKPVVLMQFFLFFFFFFFKFGSEIRMIQ